jgi:hypothetical protein
LRASFKEEEEIDEKGSGFMRALVGERTFEVPLFELPPEKVLEALSKSDMTPKERDEFAAHFKNEKIMKAERQFYAETFQALLAAHEPPFPDRLKVAEILPKRVAEAAQKNYYVISLSLPALTGGFLKEAGGLANERLALTALALENFHAATGNGYPTSLNELVPKFMANVPQDPFDGQPLRYGKVGDGYELHSIGPEPAKPLSFKVVKPPKAISG